MCSQLSRRKSSSCWTSWSSCWWASASSRYTLTCAAAGGGVTHAVLACPRAAGAVFWHTWPPNQPLPPNQPFPGAVGVRVYGPIPKTLLPLILTPNPRAVCCESYIRCYTPDMRSVCCQSSPTPCRLAGSDTSRQRQPGQLWGANEHPHLRLLPAHDGGCSFALVTMCVWAFTVYQNMAGMPTKPAL